MLGVGSMRQPLRSARMVVGAAVTFLALHAVIPGPCYRTVNINYSAAAARVINNYQAAPLDSEHSPAAHAESGSWGVGWVDRGVGREGGAVGGEGGRWRWWMGWE